MIRDATEADLPAIVAIYNASIPGRLATADTEPVSVESRLPWFRERDWARHPIWLVEDDGRTTAWLAFTRFYGRPAYAATAEVSIYVETRSQRRRAATRLLERAIEQAPRLGLTTLLGFVFAHNMPSVDLCRKFGFEQWGHLPRVASIDGLERDLLILGRRVSSAASHGARSEPDTSPG
jgi:phosphinothricin acetyltransferase